MILQSNPNWGPAEIAHGLSQERWAVWTQMLWDDARLNKTNNDKESEPQI